MCGIFGIWDTTGRPVRTQTVKAATRILQHRGPDDEGFFFTNSNNGTLIEYISDDDQDWNLAFGFRRLSIIDLSSAGHQPMSNLDNSLWIVFNGEIYNYIELRDILTKKGYSFRTATDTEVILAAYQEWGEDCLNQFNGMWGFALWDFRQKKLFCARDRFGIKPFYYSFQNQIFTFASEIKAILKATQLTREPNSSIIFDYLSYNQLDHTDETFFIGINQLAPAHLLTIQDGRITIKQYWDIELGDRNESGDSRELANHFGDLFTDSIRLHLRSDVPISTCLSGGLDSSSIVCIVNRLLFGEHNVDTRLVSNQQKTFSSCFDNPQFDERQYIEQVLHRTGAESNYIFPSTSKFVDDLPRLIWHQEEPFGSLSIFAQWCVMEKIHDRGIKVTLDGQGGDEILAGYHGYFDFFWGSLFRIGKLRYLWHELRAYHTLFGESWPLLIARALRTFAPASLLSVARHVKRAKAFGTQTVGINPEFAQKYKHLNLETYQYTKNPINNFLYANLTHLSIPKLLHYEDRNSMAFSVEARVPFLDYRLVEFAFSLPLDQLLKDGYTKIILRKAMQGVLPEEIRLRRDKMGFVTPEKIWMATDLREWAKGIIHSSSFCSRPYFNIPEIHNSFDDYIAGRRDLTSLSWRWINLELWLRQMIENQSTYI